jgi:LPS-assembly protein
MKYYLSLSALVLLSTAIQAQDVTLSCQQDELLFSKQNLSTESGSLEIIADHSEMSENKYYYLTGDVSLVSDKYYLGADKITVQMSSKTAIADGNFEFQDRSIMVIGSKANLEIKDGKLNTELEDVIYHFPKSKINGQAEKVSGTDIEQIFDSATYTLCPLGNNDWLLKASQITLNSETKRGTAKDALIEFMGVPLIYLPYHSWVLSGRGSGFLSPHLKSYNESANNNMTGYQVVIPYYFNIAPDRDLVLTSNYRTSRGVSLEGNYRQLLAENSLFDKGRIEIDGRLLSSDKLTGSKRWLVDSKIELNLNPKTIINLDIKRVSDVNYFKEIPYSSDIPETLKSIAKITYFNPDNKFRFTATGEKEQTITASNSYLKQPEIAISKQVKASENQNVDLSIVTTKFAHSDNSKVTGVRTNSVLSYNKLINNGSHTLEPSIRLTHTSYSLDNTTNQSRTMASFGLDSKFFLDSQINLFNTELVQKITPRIAYQYAPQKDQSQLPNFDSEAIEGSYDALFNSQKFTGSDRISNANTITIGLESDFVNKETDKSYLKLKVAQAIHFDDKELNINGSLTNNKKYSDIYASADMYFDDITINNSFLYDPQINKISKRDSSITYLINNRKFIALSHHDDNGALSAELDFVYPITPKVHIFGGIERSITNSTDTEKTTGIAYESCCWAVRFAHYNKDLGSNTFNQTNKLELVLKGFSSTSSSLEGFLEDSIPNYLAKLDDL